MSMVMFATLCDTCGTRSEEYGTWPTCRECLDHVCPACLVSGSYVEPDMDLSEGESPQIVMSGHKALCQACADAEAA